MFLHKFCVHTIYRGACTGKDLSVDKVLLFVFSFKFINGVDDPGTSAYDIGSNTEILPLVVVLTDAAFAENLKFCLFLLLK